MEMGERRTAKSQNVTHESGLEIEETERVNQTGSNGVGIGGNPRARGKHGGRFGCGILIHETTYAPGGGMERNKGGGNTHPPATLKQQGRNAKRGNGDAAGFSLSSNHSTQPHD
jgi:hypothetical protein